MPFVSVTRLRLRSAWQLPKFFYHAVRSRTQAAKAPGNLGLQLFNGPKMVFWTVTIWKDQAAMRAYMLSGPHKGAMPALALLADEAATTHWEQDSTEPPTRQEAHRRLTDRPHFSRIKHPSAEHAANKIPPL